MIRAPGITVNGVLITPDQINAEVQYHRAKSLPEAKYAAMQALVVRELLIQRAVSLGLSNARNAAEMPEQAIEALLEAEIDAPEPSKEECRRYYANNRDKFTTAPLFEASHIFYPAPVDDKQARKNARERAEAALRRIAENPRLFESIAHAESACSSAREGGFLGQIGKGQTLPAFESALMKMKEGEISDAPVETEVGYHLIKVHKRAEGRPLPEDVALEWVAEYLKRKAWQRAFRHYIEHLAAEAKISGFRIKGSDTPLMQ